MYDLRATFTTMKTYLSLFAAAALFTACSQPTTTGTAEQKPAAPAYSVYGDSITADGAITMEQFAQQMQGKDSMDVKLTGEVTASCAKKGCWMDMKMADGTPMKVHFKDYAFFVPKSGLEGKQAIVKGRAMKEVTDVATLRHYAEDAGKSKEECDKITAAETSWSFMADGVLIKD